jgi:hypothetical protein
MHLAYFDESGDDGYPKYSSPLFVLSAIYVHYAQWKPALSEIHGHRRKLRADYGLPVKTEMHTKQFLLGKQPYRGLGLSDAARLAVIESFCDLIARVDLKVVNTVIVKPWIQLKDYNVLDWALKAAVQRIENDLKPAKYESNRFVMITDNGRVGAMRSTTRRMQRFNPIPSKFGPTPYRAEIGGMLEDPLPKDSKESYFIQLADLIAYVVYLHSLQLVEGSSFSNRMPAEVTKDRVVQWLERLKPSLNLKASGTDPFGIVYLPKGRSPLPEKPRAAQGRS